MYQIQLVLGLEVDEDEETDDGLIIEIDEQVDIDEMTSEIEVIDDGLCSEIEVMLDELLDVDNIYDEVQYIEMLEIEKLNEID